MPVNPKNSIWTFLSLSRYKVYLEPEEDDNPTRNGSRSAATSTTARVPLAERNMETLSRGSSPSPPPIPARSHAQGTRRRVPTMSTSTTRRRSESLVKPATSSATPAATFATPATQGGVPRRSGRRSMGGAVLPNPNNSNSVRMGTRISRSALHRERLRLATEMGLVGGAITPLPPAPKKRSLDLDYDTMEVKSLLGAGTSKSNSAFVVTTSTASSLDSVGMGVPSTVGVAAFDEGEESLSESLIERFDAMESEDSEPERQIVAVTLTKDANGKLGLKITGTPAGIYVERIDGAVAKIEGELKSGDRLVAINGRSLENVAYAGALDLIKKSGSSVQFLVSQIKG